MIAHMDKISKRLEFLESAAGAKPNFVQQEQVSTPAEEVEQEDIFEMPRTDLKPKASKRDRESLSRFGDFQ